MGKRDIRWRESKKSKKSAKKAAGITSVLPTEQPVEVIRRKGKKEQLAEE